MKHIVRHTTRLGNWIWYLSVSLLVLLAILLTSTRALLPILDDQRLEVEQWVSSILGAPITIETIDARVLGIYPTLIFKGVTLLKGAGRNADTRLEQLSLSLDLIDSAWQGRLVLHELSVTGVRLALTQNSVGQIWLDGVSSPPSLEAAEDSTDSASPGITPVTRWLLSQGRLALKELHLSLYQEQGERLVVLDQVELLLENSGDRHRLSAHLALPEGYGKSLVLEADFSGPAARPEAWQGELYLNVEGLVPHNWLGGYSLEGLTLAGGALSTEFWGSWSGERLERVTGSLTAESLVVQHREQQQLAGSLSGRFDWRNEGGLWQLDVDRLVHRHGGRHWLPSRVQLNYDGKTAYRLRSSFLDLGTLPPVLLIAPTISDYARDFLNVTALDGTLRNVALDVSDGKLRSLTARFEKMSMQPWQSLPGVAGMSGALSWYQGAGHLRLDSREMALTLPKLFTESLAIEQLVGNLDIGVGDEGWILTGHDLQVSNRDIKLQLGLDIRQEKGRPLRLDIRGQFKNGDASQVSHYLPTRIMPSGVSSWLQQAFRGGRVTHGELLFSGEPEKFPFIHDEGAFRIGFHAEQVELAFHPEWPNLTEVSADAVFDGVSMAILAESGRMLNSDIREAEVRIDDFREAHLLFNGKARLKGEDLHSLLVNSQLAALGGRGAEGIVVAGESELQLDIDLPLSTHHDPGLPLKVSGLLDFAGNRVTLPYAPPIEGLHGQLRFHNDEFESGPMDGTLLGRPFTIQVATERHEGLSATTIVGRGTLEGEALKGWQTHSMIQAISGETPFQVELVVPHNQPERGVKLRLTSDWQGIALRLPYPLDKRADESLAFELEGWLSGTQQGEVAISMGPRLNSRMLFATDGTGGLIKGIVHFGERKPTLAEHRALRFTGSLSGFDLDAWLALLSSPSGSGNPLPIEVSMERLHLLPFGQHQSGRDDKTLPPLDISINHLKYDEIFLRQARIRLRPEEGLWKMDRLSVSGEGFTVDGQGEWRGDSDSERGRSQLQLTIKSSDVSQMFKTFGLTSMMSRGEGTVTASLAWDGFLSDLSLESLSGKAKLAIKDGTIEEVDAGAGKLIGLFSLQAIPKRLMLDFSDIGGKGFKFSQIEGDFYLRDGNATTDNLTVESTVAEILVTGRTGYSARDYDQMVNVVPHVSGTTTVISALAFGPQVAAAVLILQNIFKRGVDKATLTQYRVTGSWDSPLVEKVNDEVVIE